MLRDSVCLATSLVVVPPRRCRSAPPAEGGFCVRSDRQTVRCDASAVERSFVGQLDRQVLWVSGPQQYFEIPQALWTSEIADGRLLEGCSYVWSSAFVYPPSVGAETAHRAIDGNRPAAGAAVELNLHGNLLHKWVRDERLRWPLPLVVRCRILVMASRFHRMNVPRMGPAASEDRRSGQGHRVPGRASAYFCG